MAQASERTPLSGWKTHAALLAVQVAFASQAVESKLAMMPRAAGGEGMAPQAVAMVRMIGALLFFQGWSVARKLPRPSLRDHARLAGLSLLGIVVNQMLFLAGLARTTPSTAALLSVTIPVATAALSILFRKEAFSSRTVLGLVVAGSGVVTLTGVRDVDRGALLITVNCFCYAAYLVFSRDVIQRLGAFTVVTWVFTWGAVLFAPVGLMPLARMLPELTPRGLAFVAYVIAIPTILAYLLNAWALGKSNPTLVTVYIHLQPVLAALLAYFQLGYPVSAKMGIAAVLIAAGVVVVSTRRTIRSRA
jgi:drug/metabolite transporter (DMT)-like permease